MESSIKNLKTFKKKITFFLIKKKSCRKKNPQNVKYPADVGDISATIEKAGSTSVDFDKIPTR